MQAGQFLLLFQAGKRVVMEAASPPLSIEDSSYSAAEPKVRQSLDPSASNTRKGDVSCPPSEFVYIYFIFMLFMCFFHCLEQKCE
jgi:hypothetical protein